MNEEDTANHDVIEAVFYDEEHGYGNKLNTLKYAKQMNKDITMDGIHEFMNQVSLNDEKRYSNHN